MGSRKKEITHEPRSKASLTPGWAIGGWRMFGILCLQLCLFWAATAIVSPAQNEQSSANSVNFTTLFKFDYTDGAGFSSFAGLVQGADGNLYGTTTGGANNSCNGGCGTLFKITPEGTLTTLHRFDATDGENPSATLVLATDGNLYGTAGGGGSAACKFGSFGCGTIFKITPTGTLATLHNFDGSDGIAPGALIQATDGNLYGTTGGGGANSDGTVFKITPRGTLTTLHNFDLSEGEGASALVQSTDGNFYGTTFLGGSSGACGSLGCGTIFKITPGGKLTTLRNFDMTNGVNPVAGLIQGTDGNFYGTTEGGGTSGGTGTVFKITPGGTLTTLHSFHGTDGFQPDAALVQATDGNFYSTTVSGGAKGGGTVFKITPGGTLTTLHSFCSVLDCTDGTGPDALVQATNGTFYGTTSCSGPPSDCGDGTVFSLSVGLGPFVETVPTSGRVGTLVRILGTDLTDVTNVRFNGTKAVFKVVTKTLISAVVPAGATTGFVTVTTSGKTLKSNVKFRVP